MYELDQAKRIRSRLVRYDGTALLGKAPTSYSTMPHNYTPRHTDPATESELVVTRLALEQALAGIRQARRTIRPNASATARGRSEGAR